MLTLRTQANIATGVTNMSMRTIYASNTTAILVLVAYGGFVILITTIYEVVRHRPQRKLGA